MKINKNKKGFTLTELIIVIVIIGILAAILIPSLSSYIKKAKISKGEQNARNMSSLLIGEILFNDEEFLMPQDVVEVVSKSGYDLISELPDYSYWYDTETNTIKYVKLEDAITGVSAADSSVSRSRVEALSEAHPKWFYIDQTPNELKTAIDTINNLVSLSMDEIGLTSNDDNSQQTRYEILNKMDEKVEQVSKAVVNLKKIKSSETLNKIKDFISSFNTTETLYYAPTGYYNRQLNDNYSETADVYVERAMFVNATNGNYAVEENSVYESVYVHLLSPFIIPGNVTLVSKTINSIVSGVVYVSANSGTNISDFNQNVTVSSIANIQNISYTYKTVMPKYEIKEYRFRNGVTVQVATDVEVLLDKNGVILQKDGDSISPLVKSINENGTKDYYMNANGEYLTIHKDGNNGSLYRNFDEENNEKYVEYFNEYILSMYMIPTTEINNTTLGIRLSQLVSNDGLITGRIVIVSSVEPFSTQFSGIVVDADLNGYKIRSFGYITDVVANVEQNIFATAVANESGSGFKIQYKINDDDKIKVNIEIPKAAREFTNLAGARVLIEYVPQFVEYRAYPILGLSELPVGPTNVKYNSNKVVRIDSGIVGNVEDGFSTIIENISDEKIVVGENTYSANQIHITKVTIQTPINENGNISWTDIFTRYYK